MVSKRGMKDDPQFGVDSRWSWITAFFCAWVMFLTMATVRMSGIFFYGIVEAFDVTRAEASWPVSLAGTLTVLGVVILSASIFTIIPADLAADHGMSPSDAVYLLQAFSASDIAFRAVAGVAIDSRTLSHESVMLIGYIVQGLAYEWLVWLNTFPQLITASVFMGSAYGSRTCLQAPVLVKDFGITTLPVVMGGVFFATGVVLLLRPLVIGYFRDTYGDYTGLLHSLAAVNAFLVLVWTLKLIAKRKGKTTTTSKSAYDAHSEKSCQSEKRQYSKLGRSGNI
ncbi:hypothetical protein MTO96_020138 [Rhipicephalus appendiculatus]